MAKMNELYTKVANDTGLQQKLSAILKGEAAAGEAGTQEKLLAFAADAGFAVTVEEMQAFFRDGAETSMRDLSQNELDMVAGGKAELGLFASICTLGLACAIMSASAEATQAILTSESGGCADILNSDFPRF